MSNTIKLRTISSIDDKRARLSNSNFARLWSNDLGTNWTKIRVGGRISIDDTGTTITSTPVLAIGICSGTSNIFMDATTTHWAGVVSNGANWPNASANANTGFYEIGGNWPFSVTSGFYVAKRIGSTTTVGSQMTGDFQFIMANTVKATAFMLDITKGSPNFTYALLWADQTGTAHVTSDTLLAQLPLASPSISSHGYTGNFTQAIDEATNGYFNAVNISWDRTSPAIEISDIAVVRLS